MRNPANTFVRFGVFSLAILLLLGVSAASAFAQGGVGTITGTVTDPKGLSVPQAKVVVKNTDTGIVREIATEYDDCGGLRQEAIDRGSDGRTCPAPERTKFSCMNMHDVRNAEPARD